MAKQRKRPVHTVPLSAEQKAIEKVARNHGVSADEVRSDMQAAILHAFNDPDPAVREDLAKVPHKGLYPTPEEFILYYSTVISKGKNQK